VQVIYVLRDVGERKNHWTESETKISQKDPDQSQSQIAICGPKINQKFNGKTKWKISASSVQDQHE